MGWTLLSLDNVIIVFLSILLDSKNDAAKTHIRRNNMKDTEE